MSNNRNNQIANATKWSVVTELMAKLAAPIVNMVLARLLTPDEFGVVASITIITSFANIFTDAGFQKYIIQHEFSSEQELERSSDVAFTSNVILSLSIYSVIFLFREQLASAVGCSYAATGLAVAALSVLCTAFSSVAIAKFKRDFDFKPLFFIRLGSSFIPVFVTIPLAFLLKSYWAIVLGTLAQQLFVAAFSIYKCQYKPKICFDKQLFSAMVSFSAWNLLETLSIWFGGEANIFIVGTLLSAYYLGLYRTGMATINSYLALITGAITPVLFSALARAQNNRSLFEETFLRFQKTLALLVMPMGAGVFVFRDLVVQILLGSQWMEAANFMGLWALVSTIMITYSNTACEVYRSMGKPKISFALQMFYMVFYIPTIYFSAKAGFTVLCIYGTLIRLLAVLMDFLTLQFKFKISFKRIIANTYAPMIGSCVMLPFACLLRNLSNHFLWQFIAIVISAAFYFIVLTLFKGMRNELLSILHFAKDSLFHKGKQ